MLFDNCPLFSRNFSDYLNQKAAVAMIRSSPKKIDAFY